MPKVIVGGIEDLEGSVESVRKKAVEAPVAVIEKAGQTAANVATDVLKSLFGTAVISEQQKQQSALRTINELNDVRAILNAVKSPIHKAPENSQQSKPVFDQKKINNQPRTAPFVKGKIRGKLGGPMHLKANVEIVRRTSSETRQNNKIVG